MKFFNNKPRYNISEAASKSGVPRNFLGYIIANEILKPVSNVNWRYRSMMFSPENIREIKFCDRLRKRGFSLEEISIFRNRATRGGCFKGIKLFSWFVSFRPWVFLWNI